MTNHTQISSIRTPAIPMLHGILPSHVDEPDVLTKPEDFGDAEP